jgi:hypothetical protein
MEHISFESVVLAKLLARMPDAATKKVRFGIVRIDLTCVGPAEAIGKKLFDEVAIPTKTQVFHDRFVVRVKMASSMSCSAAPLTTKKSLRIKACMFTEPNDLARKTARFVVKRADKPLVSGAVAVAQKVPTASHAVAAFSALPAARTPVSTPASAATSVDADMAAAALPAVAVAPEGALVSDTTLAVSPSASSSRRRDILNVLT